MNHPVSWARTYADSWTQLSGESHGKRISAHRPAMGRTRQAAVQHGLGRCLPQLFDHPDDLATLDYPGVGQVCGLRHRHDQTHSPAVSPAWYRGLDSRPFARSACGGNARVLAALGHGGADAAPDLGLWLHDLVGAALGRSSGQTDRHPLQCHAPAALAASSRLLRASSQTHDEGQARRGCLRQSQETLATPKKKP